MQARGQARTTYFSPHVTEQDSIRSQTALASLPVTNDITSRVLILPLYDTMTDDEVLEMVAAFSEALAIIPPSA